MSGAQAVLYVHDLAGMAAFYARTAGLTPAAGAEDYRELTSDAWRLWLVRGEGDPSPTPRSAVPVKLCFVVAGDPPADAWSFAGYARVDVTDPEGNVIQLLYASSSARVAGSS